MTSEVEVDRIFPGDFPMAPPSPSPGISEIFPGNPLEIPVFFFLSDFAYPLEFSIDILNRGLQILFWRSPMCFTSCELELLWIITTNVIKLPFTISAHSSEDEDGNSKSGFAGVAGVKANPSWKWWEWRGVSRVSESRNYPKSDYLNSEGKSESRHVSD